MIDDIVTLATYLMCHLQTRNYFWAKSRDQSDDVTNQHHLSRVSPSVSFSFIPCQKAEKMEVPTFFNGTVGQ